MALRPLGRTDIEAPRRASGMSEAQWFRWGSGLTWPICVLVRAGMMLLLLGFIAPDLQCPDVVGQGCQQHDRGLVVDAPGRKAPAVEDALELRVETLGVLAHPYRRR